jgi:putative hemolysin
VEPEVVMMRRLATAVVVVGVLALGGVACGSDGDKPNIANPASEFCEAQGGTVDIVDEAGGQVGYCVLPDGTRVEEWAYYRANATTTTP